MTHRNSLSFGGLRLRGRQFRGLGGWKGKPLHPPLASVPMGTAVAALAFDVGSAISIGGSVLDRELYRSGTFVLIVGQVFVALAVLTGWWDRRRLTRKGSPGRGEANAHAWAMLVFGAVGFGGILLRQGAYSDAAHTPGSVLVLTATLAAIAVLGGTLGGSLTFEHGLRVEVETDAHEQFDGSQTRTAPAGAPLNSQH